MTLENLESSKYKQMMKRHILETIEYMFDANQEFGIACEISAVYFTPALPNDLQESLPDITLFMLANYSFESAKIDTNHISFEAGFGTENFGALVEIPLLAIKQIFVSEYPVLINVASTNDIEEEEIEEIDSMAALLNNPENAKLIKKKKK